MVASAGQSTRGFVWTVCQFLWFHRKDCYRYRVVPMSPTSFNASTFGVGFIPDRVKRVRSKPLVFGVSMIAHDATLAATLGGRVLGVIELERFHMRRYFDMMHAIRSTRKVWDGTGLATVDDAFETYFKPALKQLCELVISETLPQLARPDKYQCTIEYDVAVIADARTDIFYVNALKRLVHAAEWVWVDHHYAHATLGWLDSPFYHNSNNAHDISVIVSYDGFGNDGTMRMFIGRGGNATLSPLGSHRERFSYGFSYRESASFVRDFAWGSPYGSKPPCPYFENPACTLALPGSFMAYAALGNYRREWHAGARLLLTQGLWDDKLWPSPHGGICVLTIVDRWGPPAHFFSCPEADEKASRKLDQDFAATVEDVFESVILSAVQSRITALGPKKPSSLVVTGGCAMNVKVNSALARKLQLPAHVPPAPGDNGLALGAAWVVAPPPPSQNSQLIQFAGAPLTVDNMPISWPALLESISQFHVRKIRSVKEVTKILMDGAIVASARGRAEFGPRALGHRSLLSVAHRPEMKARLNRLKDRRWYRPCAPLMIDEDLEKIFEPGPDLAFGTPYMSFAPPLQPWVKTWLPGIVHLDNTARPQSVRRMDDPWMHSLLLSVRSAVADLPLGWHKGSYVPRHQAVHNASRASRSQVDQLSMKVPRIATDKHGDRMPHAVGVLINTSLNAKGMPMANEIQDILSVFCSSGGEELDYVLIEEEWLLARNNVITSGFCEILGIAGNTKTPVPSPDGLPSI